jgi:adenylylsulfate kinase
MARKILIMGLPGAGKTTLALALAPRLTAVHFNGDEVRGALNRDLGFSHKDRVEQARRMGWLTDQVVKAGLNAVADFVCPTAETRAAFEAGGRAYVIWMDRIKSGRFEDTNRMFDPPDVVDFRIPPEGTPAYWAEQVVRHIQPVVNPKRQTALFGSNHSMPTTD